MAFDELGPQAQLQAIDVLADVGVDDILTHGGRSGTPIEENLCPFGRSSRAGAAKGKLVILPAGGVTYENVKRIAKELGVNSSEARSLI